MSKIAKKKREKYSALIESARELFHSKGVQNTTIADIVKGAGVAKGTFYLYFSDKYDLFDKVVLHQTISSLKNMIDKIDYKKVEDLESLMLIYTDEMLNYTQIHQKTSKLIARNMSWKLFEKVYDDAEKIEEFIGFFEHMNKLAMLKYNDLERFKKDLFIILETIDSVIYSTIITGYKEEFEALKPALKEMVCRMLNII